MKLLERLLTQKENSDGLADRGSIGSMRIRSPSLPDIRSRPSATFCPSESGSFGRCPERTPEPPTCKRRSVYIDYDENDPIATLERSFEACFPNSGNVSASQTVFVEHKAVQTQVPLCKKDASTQYEEDPCLRGRQGFPGSANVKKEKNDGSSFRNSYSKTSKQTTQPAKYKEGMQPQYVHPNKHMLYDFNHPATSKQLVSKFSQEILPTKGLVDEPTNREHSLQSEKICSGDKGQHNIIDIEKMTDSLNERINQMSNLLESLKKKEYSIKKFMDMIQSNTQPNSQVFSEPQYFDENQSSDFPTTVGKSVRFDSMNQPTEHSSVSSIQSLQDSSKPLTEIQYRVKNVESDESIRNQPASASNNNMVDYEDASEEILNDIIPAVIRICKDRELSDILLMVALHDNVYHISIQERNSHEVLGYILASDKAIKDAIRVGFFNKVPSFSVSDMRNTIKPLKQLFALPFGFLPRKTMMETTPQWNEVNDEHPRDSKEKPSSKEQYTMADDEDTRSEDDLTRKDGVYEFITKVLNFPLDKAIKRT